MTAQIAAQIWISRLYHLSSKQGDADAMYSLGMFLYSAVVPPAISNLQIDTFPKTMIPRPSLDLISNLPNKQLALKYLKDAANLLHVKASLQAALMLYNGFDNGSCNKTAAINILSKGLLLSLNVFQVYHLNDVQILKTLAEWKWIEKQSKSIAFSYWLRAAHLGDSISTTMVASCYLSGEGTERSFLQSLAWRETSAQQGDSQSLVYVSQVYRLLLDKANIRLLCDNGGQDRDDIVPPSSLEIAERSLKYTRLSIEQSDIPSLNALADAYSGNVEWSAWNLTKDLNAAFSLYLKGVDLGDQKCLSYASVKTYEAYVDGNYELIDSLSSRHMDLVIAYLKDGLQRFEPDNSFAKPAKAPLNSKPSDIFKVLFGHLDCGPRNHKAKEPPLKMLKVNHPPIRLTFKSRAPKRALIDNEGVVPNSPAQTLNPPMDSEDLEVVSIRPTYKPLLRPIFNARKPKPVSLPAASKSNSDTDEGIAHSEEEANHITKKPKIIRPLLRPSFKSKANQDIANISRALKSSEESALDNNGTEEKLSYASESSNNLEQKSYNDSFILASVLSKVVCSGATDQGEDSQFSRASEKDIEISVPLDMEPLAIADATVSNIEPAGTQKVDDESPTILSDRVGLSVLDMATHTAVQYVSNAEDVQTAGSCDTPGINDECLAVLPDGSSIPVLDMATHTAVQYVSNAEDVQTAGSCDTPGINNECLAVLPDGSSLPVLDIATHAAAECLSNLEDIEAAESLDIVGDTVGLNNEPLISHDGDVTSILDIALEAGLILLNPKPVQTDDSPKLINDAFGMNDKPFAGPQDDMTIFSVESENQTNLLTVRLSKVPDIAAIAMKEISLKDENKLAFMDVLAVISSSRLDTLNTSVESEISERQESSSDKPSGLEVTVSHSESLAIANNLIINAPEPNFGTENNLVRASSFRMVEGTGNSVRDGEICVASCETEHALNAEIEAGSIICEINPLKEATIKNSSHPYIDHTRVESMPLYEIDEAHLCNNSIGPNVTAFEKCTMEINDASGDLIVESTGLHATLKGKNTTLEDVDERKLRNAESCESVEQIGQSVSNTSDMELVKGSTAIIDGSRNEVISLSAPSSFTQSPIEEMEFNEKVVPDSVGNIVNLCDNASMDTGHEGNVVPADIQQYLVSIRSIFRIILRNVQRGNINHDQNPVESKIAALVSEL